ncbi:MAG: ATP-binding protein, partial [Candidatus Nitrosocosmicus sp.]|nr:ATP-binding protein [Candidatus Nitrosocosmicus sp.]
MSTQWEDLLQSNIWWVSPTDIDKDKKIEEYNNAKIKWDPRIRKTFDYDEDIVYSLRGPRQVGKTTLIKLQISEFLHNEIPKWNILYYALDVENSPRDLVNIIKTYFTRTESVRDKEKRCYIFLDEISSIKNWQKGIKSLWDANYLKNCTLVVTGSHSVDVQRSTEKLPGRRGLTNDVYDKILLPMKFSEYVSLIDTDLRKIIEKHFTRESRQDIFLNILKNTIDVRFNELITYMPKLNSYLQQYLLTGGFPKVINESLLKFKIEEYLYTDYFRSIIGEITSLDADEGTFKRLIKYIIEHHNYPLSYRNIQNGIDIGSSNTVERYVNLLLKMFVLTLFYRYDTIK